MTTSKQSKIVCWQKAVQTETLNASIGAFHLKLLPNMLHDWLVGNRQARPSKHARVRQVGPMKI